MKKSIRTATALLFSKIVLAQSLCASGITIDTVPVGNAGNAGDPRVLPDATSGYGAVSYDYRIGRTEVTVGQYAAFLNAVASTDSYELYDAQMATQSASAGIQRSGVDGGYVYSVMGSVNHPITFVTWGDAARFANWMENGQPTGGQNASTTEDGAYTLKGALTSAELGAVSRNAGATWFIPSENEWYKAAYHKNDGVTSNYWDYPTSSNIAPTSNQPPGTDSPLPANTANFVANDLLANGYNDGYAVTGSIDFTFGQNYLTDGGAYSAALSPYGTYDQGGNVWEWTEALRSSNGVRQIRGSSWDNGADAMRALDRNYAYPASFGSETIGFRLATVPEPPTFLLAATVAVFTLSATWNRRHLNQDKAID